MGLNRSIIFSQIVQGQNAPLQQTPTLTAGGALPVGTQQFWVVTAIVGGAEFAYLNETTLTPTAGNQTANLSWSAVTGATGYNVYRSTVSGTYGIGSRIQAGLATTQLADNGLAFIPAAPAPSAPTDLGTRGNFVNTSATWGDVTASVQFTSNRKRGVLRLTVHLAEDDPDASTVISSTKRRRKGEEVTTTPIRLRVISTGAGGIKQQSVTMTIPLATFSFSNAVYVVHVRDAQGLAAVTRNIVRTA